MSKQARTTNERMKAKPYFLGRWNVLVRISWAVCAWSFVVCLSACQRTIDPIAPEHKTTVVAQEKAVEAPELFAGWPKKPSVVLFVTGQQLGYIEPCGCTGLENQKGGLARRQSFMKQLTDQRGWPVVALDVGSQVKRFGKQQEV